MADFRKGDLVIASGFLKRVEQVFTTENTGADPLLMTSHGAEHPEDCQRVTVSMGFALARFPVEEGYDIVLYGIGWDLRSGTVPNHYVERRVFGNDYTGSANLWAWEGYQSVIPYNFRLLPDLTRLPILDAWVVLPSIVRERIEALVGQEVTL